MRDAEPYWFAWSERGFLVQPGGRRAYPYVLLSADMGLTVRPNGELPPVRADLFSAWLHEVGAEAAATEVELMLAGAVFVVPPEVVGVRDSARCVPASQRSPGKVARGDATRTRMAGPVR